MGNLCTKPQDDGSLKKQLNDPAPSQKQNPMQKDEKPISGKGKSWSARSGEDTVEASFKAKRNNVFTRVELHEDELKVDDGPKKTDAHKAQIRTALRDNFIFAGVGDAEMDLFISVAKLIQIEKHKQVITQGADGDFFYIIQMGTFEVAVNGVAQDSELGPGKCFGELALLYNLPRAATIMSTTAGSLWSIDRQSFRYIVAKSSQRKHKIALDILKKVPLLQGLPEDDIYELADVVEVRTFKAGTVIFSKGSEGNIFYMIQNGKVTISDIGEGFQDANLVPGDYFGEAALLTGEPRKGNAVMTEVGHLIMIDRVIFTQKLGSIQTLMARNLSLRALCNTKIFEGISDREKKVLTQSFKEESFTSGAVIIKEGDHGDKFYVIQSGKASITVGGKAVREIENGSFFGETALMNESDVRTATVIASAPTKCFVISRQVFQRVLDSIKNKLEAEMQIRKQHASDNDNSEFDSMTMKDFDKICVLGSGTFGRVTLEKHKATGKMYALKAMLKAELVAQKQQSNVMNEKNIMMQCYHPFILRLYKTFKDARRLYMLLEFIQGGELFSVVHTSTRDGLPMEQGKFYAAGVLLALCYLHEKQIAYRDMKPENCLIDAQGYPKIVDFGFAKKIVKKSYTLCGTPEYLAPELVLGRGHNCAVDCWAFGILVYELTVGYSPFCDPRNMDQTVICRNIVNGKLVFPREGFNKKGLFDPSCKAVVTKLLERDPTKRLGNTKGGSDAILKEPWFSDIPFDAYLKKGIVAPWVPPIKGPGDTSHFDGMDDHVGDGPPYKDKTGWENDF